MRSRPSAPGGQAYSAAYDSTGDQTCRAYGSLSCTNPTPTGEALTYDQLARLIQWKNAAGTSTEQYAYDGEGERVWQQAAATSGVANTCMLSQRIGHGAGRRTRTSGYCPLSSRSSTPSATIDWISRVRRSLPAAESAP